MASDPIHLSKICTKCGVEKFATADFFRPTHKGGKAYLRNACKDCCRAETRLDMRMSYLADPQASREKQRRRRRENGDKIRERDRRYFWENREAKRASKKRFWATCDREKQRQNIVVWKAANPEKARALELRRSEKIRTDPKERAKATARLKRWREQNPEAVKAKEARRRARLVGANGSYTQDDVRALLKRQRRLCYYCCCFLTKFDCDHFIPLSRGGSNGPENIVLSCHSCNCSKGARLPWEWRPEQFEEGCKPR